jgi:hypothetical protein
MHGLRELPLGSGSLHQPQAVAIMKAIKKHEPGHMLPRSGNPRVTRHGFEKVVFCLKDFNPFFGY